MRNQRQLISEAKLRIRGIRKEISDLKRERCYLEEFIMNDECIAATRKSNLTERLANKRKYGQKHKKSKLKAALGGVRDIK